MGKKYAYPNQKGDSALISNTTLGDLFIDFLAGVIFPYENSRAALKPGGLNKSRVKAIAENFQATAIGSFNVSYDSDKDAYMLLDAHHRFAALKLMNDNGTLTPEIKSIPVSLRVVHKSEALITYQQLNQCSGLTGAEKIMNPDFMAGSYLEEWLKGAGADLENIKGGNALSLFDIALTREENSSFMVEETWPKRKITKELCDRAQDRRQHTFSDDTCKAVSQALKVLFALDTQVRTDKDYNKFAKQVMSSPGMFQVIVADHMSKGRAFGGFTRGNLKSVAKKINKNSEKLLGYCRTVARRNSKGLKDDLIATLLS